MNVSLITDEKGEETMKARSATLMIAMVLTMSLVAPTGAQTKPNVSGTWKMNREKSTFAGSGPAGVIIKFDHQEPTLKEVFTVIRSEGGERVLNLTYTLDGKPGINKFEGGEINTVASWEGASLVIVFKREEGSFTRKFTMAEDGKSMTIAVRQSGPQGENNETVFLERQ
jgi:hypothetical protein